ncbi:MAG: mechanosensitive ion channel family protein [Acidobacteriota bacterium]
MKWVDILFNGNRTIDCAVALGVAVGFMSLLFLFKRLVVHQLAAHARKTQTRVDDILMDVLGRTRPWLLLPLALHIGAQALALPPKVEYLLAKLTVIALLIQAAIWLNRAVVNWLTHAVSATREQDAADKTTLAILGFVARTALWSTALLLALDNLGFDITALLTGLGIGGIAVALAAQNILGDLFASLSIALDKPFVIGDFIIVDDIQGTVEHVGLKTTHIRSLGGERIVVSNTDLLKSRIRNYKDMKERRVLFTFGLTYQTPADKIDRISAWVREIIDAQPKARCDRAHFKEYADSALSFEIVYFVLDPDYTAYMDLQQKINIALFRRFQEEGVEFAYPTRTVYVAPTGPTSPPEAGNR